MSTETFNIPPANLPRLQEKIGKLNKRAEKLGLEPIQVKVIEVLRTETNDRGDQREVAPVEIVGTAPKVEGWMFVATLEHDEDGTIIRRIPTFGQDVDLSQYRDATPENCDHCGYKRKRNDTYIVAKTFGTDQPYHETKQVGSNCLKDFTGHESPQAIARYLEQVRNLLEEVRGGGYSDGGFVPRYGVRDYMGTVVAVARLNGGFVSKKQAWEEGGVSTADAAAQIMLTGAWTLTDADYSWADKIIEWAEGVEVPEDGDDYLHNLTTVIKGGTLTERQFGIAASAAIAYKRAQQDTHVGTVGQRVEIEFTVERSFDNEAYTTHILRDRLGRSLKWMTNVEIETGKTYRGTFNVKAHDTHERFGKQTLVNYPRDLQETK